MRRWLGTIALAAALAAGCSSTVPAPTPVTAASPAPPSAAARDAAGRLFARDGLIASDALLRYMNLIGAVLAAGRPFPHVAVTDSDLVYAVSFPGGIIAISRGSLTLMGSEAEAAVVIGREMCRFGAAGRTGAEGGDAVPDEKLDSCGVRLASAAGYDPSAFGNYLESLRERAASAREKADVDRRLHGIGATPEYRGGGKLLADRFRRRVMM